jgi:hypothetical protein
MQVAGTGTGSCSENSWMRDEAEEMCHCHDKSFKQRTRSTKWGQDARFADVIQLDS